MPDIQVVQSPALPFAFAAPVHLESAGPVTEWGRWNYVAGAPKLLLRCDSVTCVTTLLGAEGVIQRWDDPLAALAWIATYHNEPPADGPPFKGGWIGWFSYDFGRVFEPIPLNLQCADDLRLPLFEFGYHDRVWATDRRSERNIRSAPQNFWIAGRFHSLRFFPANVIHPPRLSHRANFTRDGYERAVQRAIDHIVPPAMSFR